jgi:hypothetical protein
MKFFVFVLLVWFGRFCVLKFGCFILPISVEIGGICGISGILL